MLGRLAISARVVDSGGAVSGRSDFGTAKGDVSGEVAGNRIMHVRQTLHIGDSQALDRQGGGDRTGRKIGPVVQSYAGGERRFTLMGIYEDRILQRDLGGTGAEVEGRAVPLTAFDPQILCLELACQQRPLRRALHDGGYGGRTSDFRSDWRGS